MVAAGLFAVAMTFPAAGGSAEGDIVKVTAKEFGFEPSSIKAEAGETLRIKLVNDGALSHNLHIRGTGIKTKTIQAGGTDTVEFTVPEDGNVRFFCNVPGHKQAGMTGRIETQ
ncbi:cupredoxin domain-containing protein [Ectothiorhodospiraceae bacterium WFHF3C12]|nr:cupredoxin domain-containing protein [Ectothiorhodospiraceae bacterium WFHF3C12]